MQRTITWDEALRVFRPGMKILVRLDGFEYAGCLKDFYLSLDGEISFQVRSIKKRSFPLISSKEPVSWPDHILVVNISKSLVSDTDKNKRWYFTLPRAGHAIVSRV